MLISTGQQSDCYTYIYIYTKICIYYIHICSYYFPLWFNHRILNIVFCAISRTLLVIHPIYNSLYIPMFGRCYRTAPIGFIPPVILPSLMTSYGWICDWSPMVSFVNLLSNLFCSLFKVLDSFKFSTCLYSVMGIHCFLSVFGSPFSEENNLYWEKANKQKFVSYIFFEFYHWPKALNLSIGT